METGLKRILLIRTDRLGDVVLSTPVIRYLREKYPRAFIAFMARPYTRDVVINNPDLDEVIVYDKHGAHKSLFNTIRFALGLRVYRFDAAIALHPTSRAHLIMFIAGIPNRIGYNRKLCALLTLKVPHTKQQGLAHESEYNFDLLEKAGFNTSGADRRPYMITGESDKSTIDNLMKDRGLNSGFIVVHTGASCPSKRWPPERFAEAADILAGEFGLDVVFVGGKETAVMNGKAAERMKNRAIDLTGVLNIGELAELLRRGRLFISNDSGPVHVSAAVGTPVICVFGRKDPGLSPKRWGPLGERDEVLHGDAGCEECLAHRCEKGFACLDSVKVSDVTGAAKAILAG